MKNISCILFLLYYSFIVNANEPIEKEKSSNSQYYGLHLGVLSYISFETEFTPNGKINNKFKVTRGYLTIKKEIFDFMNFRMTYDLYDDDDGVEERVKYLYTAFVLDDIGFISNNKIHFGIIQTPWIDFAEHTNKYRMQGTLPLERNDIYVSSDFGISYNCLIGGQISEDYKKIVNSNYPGKYGSITLGLYNGCGYSKIELNSLLTLQGRFTIRPFPERIPGLQISYYGIWGHGNYNDKYKTNPLWQTNLFAISYEDKLFTFLGETYFGKGDYKGAIVDDQGNPLNYKGYSLFIEGKFIKNIKLISRFDYFDRNTQQPGNKKLEVIAGVGYDFDNQNILLLDYDWIEFENNNQNNQKILKLTMQINFSD